MTETTAKERAEWRAAILAVDGGETRVSADVLRLIADVERLTTERDGAVRLLRERSGQNHIDQKHQFGGTSRIVWEKCERAPCSTDRAFLASLSTDTEQRWKCACGWRGAVSALNDGPHSRVCPDCGASGGLMLDATEPGYKELVEIDENGNVVPIAQPCERVSVCCGVPEGFARPGFEDCAQCTEGANYICRTHDKPWGDCEEKVG